MFTARLSATLAFLLTIFSVNGASSEELRTPLYLQASADYNSLLNQMDLRSLRQATLNAWRHGMNPKIYWTDGMESLLNAGNTTKLRPLANQSFLRLLKEIHLGSVNPQSAGRDVKFVQKEFLTPKQLQVVMLTAADDPGRLLDLISPQNAPYLAVKSAMEKVYPTCTSGQWQPITPINTTLRLFSQHTVIREIKQRLALLGYSFKTIDDRFDGDLLNAITDIQWNMRINPDGAISPNGKVWAFLSVSCMERVRQMQIDM